MKVKLSDIIDAIDFTDQYTEYFLDKETGEVLMVNDMVMSTSEKEEIYDQLDEHGFYRLPAQRDIDDYRSMEDFISELTSPAAEKLSRVISGRGAFRRFKDEIIRFSYEMGNQTTNNQGYNRCPYSIIWPYPIKQEN